MKKRKAVWLYEAYYCFYSESNSKKNGIVVSNILCVGKICTFA